jgi:hypothetical protein
VFFPGPTSVRAYRPDTGHVTDLDFPGTYYAVAAVPGLDRSHQCPGTASPWQGGRPTPSESADGLPPSGHVTEAAARDAAVPKGERGGIWAEPGRAWTRHADGTVTVASEVIYTVVVRLKSARDCPTTQTLWGGIPVTFLVRADR